MAWVHIAFYYEIWQPINFVPRKFSESKIGITLPRISIYFIIFGPLRCIKLSKNGKSLSIITLEKGKALLCIVNMSSEPLPWLYTLQSLLSGAHIHNKGSSNSVITLQIILKLCCVHSFDRHFLCYFPHNLCLFSWANEEIILQIIQWSVIIGPHRYPIRTQSQWQSQCIRIYSLSSHQIGLILARRDSIRPYAMDLQSRSISVW